MYLQEGFLCNILGGLKIPHLPQCVGVNLLLIFFNQSREGVLIACKDVLGLTQHRHFSSDISGRVIFTKHITRFLNRCTTYYLLTSLYNDAI